MKTIIYTLSDSSNKVRYVGKTVNLKSRLAQHLGSQDGSQRSRWINSLIESGELPNMEPIEEVEHSCGDTEAWKEAERFWIETLRFLGCELLNASKGGESGYVKTEEQLFKESVDRFEQYVSKLLKRYNTSIASDPRDTFLWCFSASRVEQDIRKWDIRIRLEFYMRNKNKMTKQWRQIFGINNAWYPII